MSYQVISLVDPSPVTVGEGGLLTSGTVSGQVALQVTSQEEFGTNQTLVLLVRVGQVVSVHLYCQAPGWHDISNVHVMRYSVHTCICKHSL